MAVGLSPEILDAPDVNAPAGETPCAIDPSRLKAKHLERVVDVGLLRIDRRVGGDHALEDRQQQFPSRIRQQDGSNLAATLEQSDHGKLARLDSEPGSWSPLR